MEWDVAAQRAENERLSAALAKLIDRNWSQDKKLDQSLERVCELESRVESTEALPKESHINQTALDVEVIGLQQRVEELESHCCHCPSSGPGIERGPSGWEPRSESVPWPTRADVDREVLAQGA